MSSKDKNILCIIPSVVHDSDFKKEIEERIKQDDFLILPDTSEFVIYSWETGKKLKDEHFTGS